MCTATPPQPPKRLAPKVPPGAMSVKVAGSGEARFATGFWGRMLRFLRTPQVSGRQLRLAQLGAT